MGLAAQLNSTTVLTPREREQRKSAQQRAEDVIYTLNHTFTCLTLTDLLIVPILRGFGMNIGHGHGPEAPKTGGSRWVDTTPSTPTEGKYGGFKPIGCEPDCGDTGHKHGGLFSKEPPTPSGYWTHEPAVPRAPLRTRIWGEIKHAFGHFSWRGARNWFVGEAIGDVGAAFVTIPVQRFFPGLMEGIRHVIEPAVGGFFRRGATRAANKWADKHELAHDNQEVVERAHEMYEYEMRHLPQMAMWTLSSIGLHFGVMKFLEKEMTVGQFARQKAATSAITAGLVFGVRALSPDKAHKWDETAGRHVVVPLTKSVGKLFGVKERDVDDYHARQREAATPKSWASRVKDSAAPAPEAVRSA